MGVTLPFITNENAATAMRFFAADKTALDLEQAKDVSDSAKGVLGYQSNIGRVDILTSPSGGTWATLIAGRKVTAAAPTVNDDINDGYQPGYIWIDSSGPAVYICASNTVGAADWNQIDAAGGGGGGSLDDAYNSGATITVDAGAVTLDADTADTSAGLAITREPGSSAAAVALSLLAGVNSMGAVLSITNNGTGPSIDAGGEIRTGVGNAVVFDGGDGHERIVSPSDSILDIYSGNSQAFRILTSSTTSYNHFAPASTAIKRTLGTASVGWHQIFAENADATTDALITADRSPSSSAAAPVLDLTAGANNIGAVISITNNGTGPSIDADGDILLGDSNRLEFRSTEYMSSNSFNWSFTLNGAMRLRYTYTGNVWSFQGAEVRPHTDEVCQLGSASFNWKALYVSNTDADTESGVTINRSPSSSFAAPVLDLTAGVNNAGAVISITNSGTGESISAGAGDISVAQGQKYITDGAGGNDYMTGASNGTMQWFLNGVQFMNISSSAFNVNISGNAAAPALRFAGSTNGLYRNGNALHVAANGADAIAGDNDSTAGNTRLLVYDVDNATLERVTVGAADSGGVGFKVLRIPN